MLHSDWRRHVKDLYHEGQPVGPRGFATHEMLKRELTFDPRYALIDSSRDLNFRFAVAEWVWMMFGKSDVESVAQFNGVLRQFSDDGVWLTGAYGPHIKAQARRVLEKLRKDQDSRQAVIVIPRPANETKDEPCTISFQFLIRNRCLSCIVSMRSSDAWLGVPYDAYTFAQILNCFAGELKLPRGFLTIQMGSAHVYTRDFPAVLETLRKDPGKTLYVPALPGFPPAWLERVLETRHRSHVPLLTGSEELEIVAYETYTRPWLPYAEVLLSPSRHVAGDILRDVSRRSTQLA